MSELVFVGEGQLALSHKHDDIAIREQTEMSSANVADAARVAHGAHIAQIAHIAQNTQVTHFSNDYSQNLFELPHYSHCSLPK